MSPLELRQLVERLESECDMRVRRVLEHAKRRDERRQEALRRITAARPPAPEGQLVLMHKAHQQALAAWEGARLAVEQLVVQAQRLAKRLRALLDLERVRDWQQR